MFFIKRKKKNVEKKYYVIAICKTADINTKYGEYPCKFDTCADARNTILSYGKWGEEILRQEENYTHKPAGAWKIKNKWLVIEEKLKKGVDIFP